MNLLPLSDELLPAVQAFARENFGRNFILEPQFWKHWYHPPWSDSWNGRVLIDDNDQVQGVAMLVVVPAKFGNKNAHVAWFAPVAVSQKAQKVGAGAQLFFWAFRSLPLVGGISTNDLSAPISKLFGKRIGGIRMNRFISVHSADAKQIAPEASMVAVANAAKTKDVGPHSPLKADWHDKSLPDDYDDLWRRVRKNLDFTTDRTRDYMTWRYIDTPFQDYRLLSLRAKDNLKGMAVVRLQDTPQGQICRIVDVVAANKDATDVWRRLRVLLAEFGALYTDFFVIGNRFDSALEEAGFHLANEDSALGGLPHLFAPMEHRGWNGDFYMAGSLAKENDFWRDGETVFFSKGDADRDWPTQYDLDQRAIPV